MPYVISEARVDVKDQSCVRECPVDCIYEGERQLYIHPEVCIDCGACEPVCPENAIYDEGELPAGAESAAENQTQVLVSLGVLNGARRHGPLHTDHPYIAALPPRPERDRGDGE
jgi:ferredoxin